MDDDRTGPDEPSDALARPDLRVGDVDRQAALAALGAHLEAGRLDVDEYGDRSAHAAVAVHRADLAALFDDLPAPHPALPERPTGAVPAPVDPPGVRHGRDRPSGAHAALIGFVMVMVIALPGLMFAAAETGFVGGGGLLFLPLIVMLAGSARHGRRRFGPGGHGHGGPGRGPWHV